MTREEIFKHLNDERGRQMKRWGPDQLPSLGLGWYLVALGEEVGEANAAALEMIFGGDPPIKHDLIYELVQVAAVAIAIIEELSPLELNETTLDKIRRGE